MEVIEVPLELLEEGAGVPAELLMTADDIELERALAQDRTPSLAEEQLIEAALGQPSP